MGSKHVMNHTGSTEIETRGLDALTDHRIQARLTALTKAAAHICRDAGCPCIADRLHAGQIYAPIHRHDNGDCAHEGVSTKRLPLNMLAKLAPLAQAMARAGYYDVAMLCVELAMVFEDTWDLKLARAYLCVLLGEMDEAGRIYSRVVEHLGAIPKSELDRLAQLASEHGDEEDILELHTGLMRYCSSAGDGGAPRTCPID